ncbi:MAG TPA: hypothetical protein PLE73_02920 [Spirochaetota bacterium]|nr:hypothetical protein [Spirochaetota bacterium]HPI22121.1 hypothetical protein [Spirochaetota bacterium]HPU90375.1 hypothetical protein [Spirochaetota bacterium]
MPHRVLTSTTHRAIMNAVMRAIVPRGGPFAAGAADYDLIPRVREILLSYHPIIARGFGLVLWYVHLSALPRYGRPFASLPEETATAFLASMEHSPLYYRRSAVLLLKLLTFLALYDIDEVARAIGYAPDCGPDRPGRESKRPARRAARTTAKRKTRT